MQVSRPVRLSRAAEACLVGWLCLELLKDLEGLGLWGERHGGSRAVQRAGSDAQSAVLNQR
jgi:hypothetical protein